MDYATFSDAFAHNRRSKEHLTNLLRTRIDKMPHFALFLGAGASVTSGVNSASTMVDEWRKELYASYKGRKYFDAWLKSQDWYQMDDEYSRLFEAVYDQPSQRRTYIEKHVREAKPGWGYAYLVSLVKNGTFNVIFTTNFDDLINDACHAFDQNLRPMVCAHDSAVSSVRLTSDRPKVIKLHGDYLYDSIKNTSSELQSLQTNMRDKFVEFAKELGLVVVGYGGNDQSIMDLLDVLVRSENYFRNGIYWCIRTSSSPGRRVTQLLRNDRVYWVETEGFDELMAELAFTSGYSLPDGITAPHSTALKRSEHLLKPDQKVSHPILTKSLSDLREVYTRIHEALKEVGLSEWSLEEPGIEDKLYELTTEFLLPIVSCTQLIKKKKIKEACEQLKPIVANTDSKAYKIAWAMLMDCYLQDKSLHDDAKELLAAAPIKTWQDSSHYLQRSYYALHLCNAEDALAFVNRALELNRDLAPAKVNKAISLHMLGRRRELAPLLKDLKSTSAADHHKAAAYAMEGKLEECMNSLQRAIVLGRYSVRDACRDVAFRVFWGLEPFERYLRPFSQDKPFIYPLRNPCPMSKAERTVRGRVSAHTKKSSPTSGPKLRRKTVT